MKKRIINFSSGLDLYLDYEDENLDPRIVAHVREASVDVERALFEEVHSESFSQDMRDSLQLVVTVTPQNRGSR